MLGMKAIHARMIVKFSNVNGFCIDTPQTGERAVTHHVALPAPTVAPSLLAVFVALSTEIATVVTEISEKTDVSYIILERLNFSSLYLIGNL